MAKWLGIGVLLLVGLVAFSRVFWHPFWIPSGSMKPTLLIGDYIIVNTWKDDLQRGDVVVLKHPSSDAAYVERLIGLAGDKVQLMDGLVYVNDQPVSQNQVDDFVEQNAPQGPFRNMPRCQNVSVGLGADCIKGQMQETLGAGKSYFILDIADGQADNTPVYTVPDGHLFFLGDNRDNSADSRYPLPYGLGMVPEDNVIGPVSRVLFSSAGSSLWAFWTWRSDRYLVAVQ